jgi:hypothetical protein
MQRVIFLTVPDIGYDPVASLPSSIDDGGLDNGSESGNRSA